MHELSYCEGVLQAVERRAKGRRVSAIGVRIGVVHRIVPEAFAQTFALAALGGPAADARTEVVVCPIQGHCWDCQADFDADDPSPACPSCGSWEIATQGGDEVILTWLSYADTTAADDAAEPISSHTHGEPSPCA
jgi:hydrogenase nickel incorporation protein HypA/HybF